MTIDFDVIVAGELNVDLILRDDVTPAMGQDEARRYLAMMSN